ncbi:UNVERIFIED_CONTAM: hypothetical protein HDU68_012444 [Siphonaria sp. JEL0065]|nr:hypothetical protein HDU68_012444 [Siphonaria sp. JEL0065]
MRINASIFTLAVVFTTQCVAQSIHIHGRDAATETIDATDALDLEVTDNSATDSAVDDASPTLDSIDSIPAIVKAAAPKAKQTPGSTLPSKGAETTVLTTTPNGLPLTPANPLNMQMSGLVKLQTPDGKTVTDNFHPTLATLAEDQWECEDVQDDGDAVCFDVTPGEKLQDVECVEVFDDFVDFACEVDRVDDWECDSDPFPVVSAFSFGGALGPNGIPPMMPGGIMVTPPMSGGMNGTDASSGGGSEGGLMVPVITKPNTGNSTGSDASTGGGITPPATTNGNMPEGVIPGNPNLGTNGNSATVTGLKGSAGLIKERFVNKLPPELVETFSFINRRVIEGAAAKRNFTTSKRSSLIAKEINDHILLTLWILS